MIKELLTGRTLGKMTALFCILAILACIAPPSSAGTDAKIALTGVRPTELAPGDTKAITLTVKNGGSNDARQITLNFQESQHISVVGSSSVYINSIDGWCSKDVVITVHVSEGTPSGTYSLPVTCTFSQYCYDDATQDFVTKSMPEVSYSIVFIVEGGALIDVSDVDLAEMKPGEETELKFTITNIGNSPLRNLVFSWNEGEGVILPIYSDNTKYIEYIDAGESVEVAYTVVADVNAEAGVYQLDLSFEFEGENGGSSATNTTAGVVVGGETDFDVTFSESSAGGTSFSVANTGNNPAYSVTVRIPQQENFKVQGSTASIVGNLDKGDYTIVSFQITSASQGFGGPDAANHSQQRQLSEEERQKLEEDFLQRNAAQNNNLDVLIEYTDAMGLRQTIEKNVPIQLMAVGSGETQFNSRMRQQQSIWENTTLIGVVTLVVFLVGGFIYYKKRKRGNKFLTRFSREKKE
jgi:hypothetical protein